MSGICGWIGGAVTDAAQTLEAMSATLAQGGRAAARSALLHSGAVAVAGNDVNLFEESGRMAAVWGAARFTDTGLAELAGHRGIAGALAEGYARKGAEVLALLSGSFALAVFDVARGEAVLATDRMGMHPLCYAETGGRLAFASSLDCLNAFPGIGAALDRQSIYDYVYFHMVPGPQTIYAGRRRLLPGQYIHWRNGSLEARQYWEMRYDEDEDLPLPELKERFLALLRQSVREAAADGNTGTFLSGGTDSSTIAGILGEVTGEPARTFSIGFEAQGYDEMDYARIAARHFGTRHHEYYVTPADIVSGIPKVAAAHDQPFGNSSAVPTYYCARLARDNGVGMLLGGDGGDELFGGNERYATQYKYSLYSDLPGGLRKGLIEPMMALAPEIGLVGKAKRYIRTASLPMPSRYDNYNLLERLGPDVVFTGEFLASVDRKRPAAQMAQTWQQARAQSLVNRMMAFDLKYTLADSDLPKVSRSCELAGVGIRYPLLHDAVVAFSARLAPDLKLKGARLRYFFKEALRGFLPDEIIRKTKHGFGLPFGPWLETHDPLRQIALDSLADLKKRGIVRPEFIDELASVHLRSHAGYYGTMVWILMMLEQWFQRQPAPPR